ncbi:MAG: pyrroloquinoline-quinone synthase PqqC [Gemmatimonadota bacterium]|nr:pyrroloquinoline-quinone synthase PqqC [Gemmatimonadota bacterium]
MQETLRHDSLAEPWTEPEFVDALRSLRARYHDLHPFNRRMNAGELSPDELRLWVANRFYYQVNIPIKDAAILSNCPDPEVRRNWIQRVVDHDGGHDGNGGIEKWLRLGEAMGLAREELKSERHVLPAVRFAVDAYVNFCRQRPWVEAVAASLTELFGPDAIRERIPALEQHYPWIDPRGFDYFRRRLTQAPRDAEYALKLVLHHCTTREQQERAVRALAFKCDVLWVQMDALNQGETRPPLPTEGGNR